MTRLHDLYDQQGQSPWIDNLSRPQIRDGDLQRLIDRGVRGVTSNPSIFQKAMTGSTAYDEQFGELISAHSIEEAYWEMAFRDVADALAVMRPVHEATGGTDGFVSLELAPGLARDSEASVDQARRFHQRLDEPNLLVKIPATEEGVPAIQQMIAEGYSINITLIFSLERYAAVVEAYLAGLEARDGDLSGSDSVASFFVSRVDTEVDRRLDAIGTPKAFALRGKVAVAQARMAYALFLERFSGPRWEALAARGAKVQRPLWASTSTKNPEYDDLLYVDTLIGPSTVNTLPNPTLEAFVDHGTVARTIDDGLKAANDTYAAVEAAGVDLRDVHQTLEEEGVAAFSKAYDELLQSLSDKANGMTRR
ncbi:MAG: transaldolase [Acidimicrobiales bacterium]